MTWDVVLKEIVWPVVQVVLCGAGAKMILALGGWAGHYAQLLKWELARQIVEAVIVEVEQEATEAMPGAEKKAEALAKLRARGWGWAGILIDQLVQEWADDLDTIKVQKAV